MVVNDSAPLPDLKEKNTDTTRQLQNLTGEEEAKTSLKA
jgi:hypothetical protein